MNLPVVQNDTTNNSFYFLIHCLEIFIKQVLYSSHSTYFLISTSTKQTCIDRWIIKKSSEGCAKPLETDNTETIVVFWLRSKMKTSMIIKCKLLD